MAKSLSSPDRVNGLGTPIKADPLDPAITAMTAPPTYPYPVPTRMREAYLYTGASVELATTGDYCEVVFSGLTTADHGPDQYLPFALIANDPGGDAIYLYTINKRQSGITAFDGMFAAAFTYPVVLDDSQIGVSGNSFMYDNEPPGFYASTQYDVWHFKFTRNGGAVDLSIWKAGSEADTVVNTYSLGGRTTGQIIVGSAEAFVNPYYQDVVRHDHVVIQSVTWSVA